MVLSAAVKRREYTSTRHDGSMSAQQYVAQLSEFLRAMLAGGASDSDIRHAVQLVDSAIRCLVNQDATADELWAVANAVLGR